MTVSGGDKSENETCINFMFTQVIIIIIIIIIITIILTIISIYNSTHGSAIWGVIALVWL